VITICDRLQFFQFREFKREIGRKSADIPSDRLIESGRGCPIELCEISIEDNPLASNRQDGRFDCFNSDD
jgi:hypothetical protein